MLASSTSLLLPPSSLFSLYSQRISLPLPPTDLKKERGCRDSFGSTEGSQPAGTDETRKQHKNTYLPQSKIINSLENPSFSPLANHGGAWRSRVQLLSYVARNPCCSSGRVLSFFLLGLLGEEAASLLPSWGKKAKEQARLSGVEWPSLLFPPASLFIIGFPLSPSATLPSRATEGRGSVF